MPEKEKTTITKTHYVRRSAHILLRTIIILILLVLFTFLLVLTPPVQRFLTGRVENYLQQKLNTEVNIERIGFSLSGNVYLNNFYIADQTGDTLLAGRTLKAQVNYMKLFSNEVDIKDVELQHVTAKIKRLLPDTLFNFQFVVDAFAAQKQNPDTTETAPLILNVSNMIVENSSVLYNDVISGIDMFARIGYLSTTIDTLDPYIQKYDISTLILRNTNVTMKQVKPLLEPKPVSQDIAEARTPNPLQLNAGTIDVTKLNVKYSNDVSAVYSTFQINRFITKVENIDLANNAVHLARLELTNSKTDIRLGKSPQAEVVKKQVKQNVEAEAQAGWNFRIDQLNIENNRIVFNDENLPKQNYGMDYAHLDASDVDLNIHNLLFTPDSIGGQIQTGSFKEKSGFTLNELRGDLLYANNISYLKDLYIKTPGSEVKRSLVLEYASFDALTRDFPSTVMSVHINNSYVQVKDILTFAPQLRTHPAFRNTSDVWHLNLIGAGTMNHLTINRLEFDGLKDTHISASGTLTSLMNPNAAGGNFTIYNLHTTQTDLSLFTGSRLSTAQVNLPETFDASGTIAGNAGRLQTNLNISTSSGFVAVNGTFGNIMNPSATTYSGRMQVRGLQMGKILREPATYGTFTGSMRFNGRGFTPESISGNFAGHFSTAGYNRYQYSNVNFNGSIKGSSFNVTADVNDPNADLNLTATGTMAANSYFTVRGMVDSIKLHRLNFATDPLTFRGRIDADVANLNPDYLDADVYITEGLLVANNNRLPIDTAHLLAARTDSGQLIRVRSPIANAQMLGRYRITELGDIIQNNIAPYFSVSPQQPERVSPYDISFYADIFYSPVLAGFVPDLKAAENVHIKGNLATGEGLQAVLTSPYIEYQDNQIRNAVVNVTTDASGMHVNGTVGHLKSGTAFEAYNARIRATALHNNIDFGVALDGKTAANKYVLAGNITQPATGTMRIHLRPDSLVLNYERWNVNPGNSITIAGNSVRAENFVLSQGGQQLALQSLSGSGEPLQVTFTNFRIGTLTGFMKADTTLIDGVTNGTVTFRNLMTQPVFTSDLQIADLSFRQDTIGNVNVQVSSSGKAYVTNATISGRGNDVVISGSFAPQGNNDLALNLTMDIRQLNMATVKGALKEFITDATGNVTGNVRLTGTTSNPDIDGRINFDNTRISTVALGGPLTIDNETLNITNDGFVFDRFTILDSAGNRLTINGTARTNNFINYNFNLSVSGNNFRVLNVPRQNNSLYFGDLVISTQLNIAGTEQAPKVDGSITVEDGTTFSFVVPQQDPSVVSRKGIVEFVNFDNPLVDSLFLAAYDSLNRTNLIGYDVSTNIEIKREAIFNIVIDEANGDFMNLQGEALLSAGIDPGGKITLTGSYELTEGFYQINYNLLRRQFAIQEGSKIVWLGEPTNATVDVSAIYIANAAPLDLVANYISAPTDAIRNTYLQKLPFEVHLNMTGELMQPDIAFDIQLPSDRAYSVSGDVTRNVDIRLAQLRQQTGELNKQVFALLVLNRFVGENPFESSGEGFSTRAYARQSVTRLLTEQLNRLADDLIAGVDIDFDVISTDDYSTGSLRTRTDLNVGLSKSLLNDRLTVTVGSNFELDGGGAQQGSQQRSSNFAGNVAITYLLSRDGKYRLRIYRQNQFFGAVEGYIVETGVRFIITLDFNQLSDILRRKQVVQNGERSPRRKTEGQ